MGCDIHAHIEIKVEGVWLHWSQPRIRRNYTLFGKIAGVRAVGIKPITAPKGLPPDLSLTTKLHSEYWSKDGHDFTWLNANELNELCSWALTMAGQSWNGEWEHTQLGYLFGNGIGDWIDSPKSYPEYIEDVRMVCWFDN